MAPSIRCGMLGAMSVAAALGLALAGCGDDSAPATGPPTPVNRGSGATPGTSAGSASSKNPLVEKPHIEDRVGCPIPEQPSDPRDGKCDPKAPSCGEHLYCLTLAQGSYCEPCPERDGIRHVFKERDFDGEHNRDPFQSFLVPLGLPPGSGGGDTSSKQCPRDDQMVASTYSYADLKLVGIVAQGTVRKVLMMGGPLGYIIKRGDCVGKEKAVVKDIGTGYITFELHPDASAVSQRPPEEVSVQLHPKQLRINDSDLPVPAPRTTIAPVVPRPPRAPASGGSGAPPAAIAPAPPGGSASPPAEAPPGSAAAKKP